MQTSYQPHLSHFGVFCRDIERMKDFYCAVFDLQETDRGVGFTFPFTIVFLSGHADQHHQLALASSRDPEGPSTVMQISFKVQTLDHLREARRRALAGGATRMRGLNHGNALSIYCMDPEDNTVEVYLDTPWYVNQPHGDPLDLEQDDAAIWAETERIVRADPSFMPVEEWSARFAARRGSTGRSAMNTTADDERSLLLDLEQQRCQAMMAADFAHLRTLLHPDLVHIHAKGQVDDYASYFSSGGVKVDYRRVERADLRVRLLGDTALMSGRQQLEAVRKDGTGTVHIDSQVLQVWTRGAEGRWQQLSFQTTPLSMRVE